MEPGRTGDLYGNTRVTEAERYEHEDALWAKRITEIASNMQMRVAYDVSGNAIYVGYGARGLADGDDGWIIHKYTYNVSNQVTQRQIAYDEWDNKATTASYA